MANKVPQESLPKGKVFNAVNVVFTDTGEAVFPSPGAASVYSGDCHSHNESEVGTLFVEDGDLKLLASPTPITLLASVGDAVMSYTRPIGERVYFSNGAVTGKYTKGDIAATEWGTPVPANPTCTAITTGGMYAGTYRVVITWIADEESGAGASTVVTVAEGGGITLTGFPSPPSYVDYIGVYVSSVNGEDMYLYGEYAANTSTVTISYHIGEVSLTSHFCYPPAPPAGSKLLDHQGRIYYTDGPFLFYTHAQQYGLQEAASYYPFDSDIQTVISRTSVIYVGTETMTVKVTNIDGDDPPLLEMLQDCGSFKGSECYHKNGSDAFFMGPRGLVKCTLEGIVELTYKDVALPLFASGSSTILYENGMDTLIFVGEDGTQNPLASDDYNALEWADAATKDSAWAVNCNTGAVSKLDNYAFTRVSGTLGVNASGLFELGGATFAGAKINGHLLTGKMSLGSSYKKTVTDFYSRIKGGPLKLLVSTDNSKNASYTPSKTTQLAPAKANLGRGAVGVYWQFRIENSGNAAHVSDMEIRTEMRSKRI